MRLEKFAEGEYYHVYNRGNSKQPIFLDNKDKERFLKILYITNGTRKFRFKDDILGGKINSFSFEKGVNLVDICAYALMLNHFHLYIYVSSYPTCGKINNLSYFMKRLTTSYSKYFNGKYNRTGGLFEGRFKAEHIHKDEYFKYLFSYIHLNPIKLIQKDWQKDGIMNFEKAREFLHGYKYSSFIDYFVDPNREQGKILNKESFLKRIDPEIDLQASILDWMKLKDFQS